jgi:hypothetical protein
MKFKYKTETEHEANIQLPFYFKIVQYNTNTYYGITSEDNSIMLSRNNIYIFENPESILNLLNSEFFVNIDSAEFKTALTQKCNNLINLI